MAQFLMTGAQLILVGIMMTVPVMAQDGSLRATPAARSADEYRDAQLLNQPTEPQKLLSLAQQFNSKYPDSEIRPVANRYIVSAFIQLKDYPQAIANAERALKENPDNITIMTEICRMGSEAAHTKDFTNAVLADQMGRNAIVMIENGKIPLEYKPEIWRTRRDAFLGSVYKSLGVLAFYQNKMEDGGVAFQEATRRLPNDPYCFYMLAKCRQQEITKRLTAASTKETAKKDNSSEKDRLEDIIYNMARAFVLSEQSTYQWLHSSVENELKYLIDNFKPSKSLELYVKAAREEINVGPTHVNP